MNGNSEMVEKKQNIIYIVNFSTFPRFFYFLLFLEWMIYRGFKVLYLDFMNNLRRTYHYFNRRKELSLFT